MNKTIALNSLKTVTAFITFATIVDFSIVTYTAQKETSIQKNKLISHQFMLISKKGHADKEMFCSPSNSRGILGTNLFASDSCATSKQAGLLTLPYPKREKLFYVEIETSGMFGPKYQCATFKVITTPAGKAQLQTYTL